MEYLRSSRSLVISHSQFSKIILDLRTIYYLRTMILGRHCLKMTRCSRRGSLLHRLSLLVGLEKVTIRKLLLFELRYRYYNFSLKSYKIGISQKNSRSLVISHSQYLKFVLEFRMVVIVWKRPGVVVAAVFTGDWKESKSQFGMYFVYKNVLFCAKWQENCIHLIQDTTIQTFQSSICFLNGK